jgi:hypothetical protein
MKSNRATLYFLLAAVGLVVPWIYNIQYFAAGGSVMPGPFFNAAFANVLTTAITLDVYISAIVFCAWMFGESFHLSMRHAWLYVVLTFCIGLSFAFPLFLAMRERALTSSKT